MAGVVHSAPAFSSINCLKGGHRMSSLMTQVRDERGATATEYALLGGFIAVVIATSVGFFGQAIANVFLSFPDIWP